MNQAEINALIVAGCILLLFLILYVAVVRFERKVGTFDGVDTDKPEPKTDKSKIKPPPSQR